MADYPHRIVVCFVCLGFLGLILAVLGAFLPTQSDLCWMNAKIAGRWDNTEHIYTAHVGLAYITGCDKLSGTCETHYFLGDNGGDDNEDGGGTLPDFVLGFIIALACTIFSFVLSLFLLLCVCCKRRGCCHIHCKTGISAIVSLIAFVGFGAFYEKTFSFFHGHADKFEQEHNEVHEVSVQLGSSSAAMLMAGICYTLAACWNVLYEEYCKSDNIALPAASEDIGIEMASPGDKTPSRENNATSTIVQGRVVTGTVWV